MRIAMGIGGDVLSAPIPPTDIVEQARQAEEDGFPSAWTVHFTRGVDALNVLAVAGPAGSNEIVARGSYLQGVDKAWDVAP